MCLGNELFFCMLYVLHHLEEPAGKTYPHPLFLLLSSSSSPNLCFRGSLVLLAVGRLCCDLPAEVGHQPPAPHHSLSEHGRPGRGRASQERQDPVRE